MSEHAYEFQASAVELVGQAAGQARTLDQFKGTAVEVGAWVQANLRAWMNEVEVEYTGGVPDHPPTLEINIEQV